MSSGKKTTTTSNQQQTATTQLPEWMTGAGQQVFNDAQAYQKSGAMTWTPDKAAAYANPWQQQVVDRTKAGMVKDNAVELRDLDDRAQAARSFGGTRHAVLEGQVRDNQSDRMLDYESSSRAQGYDAARASFEADRAAQMGGFTQLQAILAGAPKNVTTTGTSSGTQVQNAGGSFLDTVLGLGQLGLSAAATFSDPRLKKDVGLIERLASGLGIYRFRYLWEDGGDEPHIGVMADEVARIAPEALGPVTAGYLTVNYGMLVGAL